MINKMVRKMNLKYLIAISCFFILSLFLIMLPFDKFIGITSDELGYLYTPAKITGWPWQEAFQNYPYYGVGVGLLWVPLFYLFNNFTLIYKSIVVLNAIILILSFLISIRCSFLLFPTLNRYLAIFGCLIIVFYPSNIYYALDATSETLLYLLFWIIFYIMIKVVLTNDTKWYIILGVVASYMILVHLRTLVEVISIVLFILLLQFYYKKIELKKIIIFLMIFAFGYFITSLVQDQYILSNGANQLLNSTNTHVNALEEIYKILINFKFFVQGVFGELFAIIVSGGFFSYMSIKSLILDSTLLFRKKNEISVKNFISLFLVITLFCCLVAYSTNKVSLNRLDGTVYLRYMENIMGPFLLYGFLSFLNKRRLNVFDECVFVSTVLLGAHNVIRMIPLSETNLFDTSSSVVIGSFFDLYVINVDPAFTLLKICTITIILYLFILCINQSEKISFYIKYKFSIILMLIFWCVIIFNSNSEQIELKNSNFEIYSDVLEVSSKYNTKDYLFLISNLEDSDLKDCKYIQLLLGKTKLKVESTENIDLNFERNSLENVLILSKNNDLDIDVKSLNKVLENEKFSGYIFK